MSTSSSTTTTNQEPSSRAALRRATRVCIKAGTSVVANDSGRPSLTRLGAIIEQISELMEDGVEVIFVSSGAVGMGKRLLKRQSKMLLSLKDLHSDSNDKDHHAPSFSVSRNQSFVNLLDHSQVEASASEAKKNYDSACAAAGQYEMVNLYQSLLGQYNIGASQLLVTQDDFVNPLRKQNLSYVVERLLSLGILPIINENDAVSGNLGYTDDDVFSDNDSLAALCARNFGAEVLLLLTDVDGVYDKHPSDPTSSLLPVYLPDSSVKIGQKSAQGRGGMASKIAAALSAVEPGTKCRACVVAPGTNLHCIRAVLKRGAIHYGTPGTLFPQPGSELEAQARMDYEQTILKNRTNTVGEEARIKAVASRTQARKLQALPYSIRQTILVAIADALVSRQDEIMAANERDIELAQEESVSNVLLKRLKLTEQKIATLAAGLKQIANLPDPLGVIQSRRELAQGLELSQITVPIGVLLIIFESRPECMPQIAALALASSNGLLLKGGREAIHSNTIIHQVIGDAIEGASGGAITRDIIGLVTSRGQVAELLSLDDVIDLVIPRGSNALVRYIKTNTRIPVLGHADGVCHVYVDASASSEAACQIVVDAKIDYPSACNAMETLLLHEETVSNGVAAAVMMALRVAGVRCLGGPLAMKMGLCDNAAEHLKFEYGDLTCMVEVMKDMDQAIDWIHNHGSGHTECIVCADDSPLGEEFLKRVDAACVFKNASTRFADGFRFGLGAEVGISTGRIHARGPVGVEGLLTTKWQLRSNGVNYVGEYGGEHPKKVYTHKELM